MTHKLSIPNNYLQEVGVVIDRKTYDSLRTLLRVTPPGKANTWNVERLVGNLESLFSPLHFYCCEDCGDLNIETTSWMTANGDVPDGGEAPQEYAYCPTCAKADATCIELSMYEGPTPPQHPFYGMYFEQHPRLPDNLLRLTHDVELDVYSSTREAVRAYSKLAWIEGMISNTDGTRYIKGLWIDSEPEFSDEFELFYMVKKEDVERAYAPIPIDD